MTTPQLILASSSPRRRALLTISGYSFTNASPDVDETPLPDELPEDMVVRLAVAKARAVATAHGDAHVFAADTVVVVDGDVLGKPVDEEQAVEMLLRIADRTHVVLTGCALASPDGQVESLIGASLVTMRAVSRREAVDYAATGEPLDKAGAYALQGAGAAFVTAVDGPRSNVIGLPLDQVVPLLARHGFERRATSTA